MLLKHYNHSGIVTWSNSKANSHLLAHAPLPETEEGPFNLDILALDLTEKSKQLAVLGSTNSPNRFRCLAWDNYGEKDGTHQNGLIFGGMEDGGITLWDPYQIISAKKAGSNTEYAGLVYQEEPILDYPVICAQWNALKPNLLGFGTTQVLVMDIGQGITQDGLNIFKISQKNPHAGSYITAVAWNKEVAHIMASASDNGLIALWDVKVNKSIFSFNQNSSASPHKNVSIAWSKSVFAQIAVTLDDEYKNQLQIWDLRNQKGPIVVIDKNHSKGINCMDWSDNDPQLILASSKDNKVICWNYVREQPVSETQLKEPIVDIKWSKKLPSIYYVSTQSKLEIFTMDDNNLYSYVPKWYKVPVGTCIGANNNILAYDDKQTTTLKEYKYSIRNQKLQPSIRNLENFLRSPDITNYLKSRKNSTTGEEQGFWNLMELMNTGGLESDIYNYLGFDKDNIIKSAEKYTNKKYDSPSRRANKVAKTNDYISYTGEDASNFFSDMMNKNFGNTSIQQAGDSENVKYEMVPRNFNWDTGKQKIIKQNLLIGNYTGAIDAALKCGRGAEALAIAYSQGQDIFKSTLKTFFTETTDDFIKGTLRFIADKQLEELVKKYPIHQWKECVAFIYSLVHDHRAELLKALAQRLLQDTDGIQEALICLSLAEDFNELLGLFNKLISGMKSGTERKAQLIDLVEKLLVIKRITTKQVGHSALFDRFILEATMILLEEGQSLLASQLIQVANVNNEKIAYIRYLIAESHPETKGKINSPFKPFNIPVMQKKVKKQQKIQQEVKPQVNNVKGPQKLQPAKPGRPAKPIFNPPPVTKLEDPATFNPSVGRTPQPIFNPNQPQQPSYQQPTYQQSKPNVAPPPPNLRKPQPVKPVQVPVNIPPKKEQIQSTFTPSQPYNPGTSNPTRYETSSSHLTIPATSIPSITVRNKPPPPPPKIKKAESTQSNEIVQEQKYSTSNYQSKPSNEYQHPPPPPSRTNHPLPPPASNPNNTYILPAQQTQQYHQPAQQIQQIQPQVQTLTSPVVPPAGRKPVPPPPRRN